MSAHPPALVTGGARRLGRAIAVRLARDGHDVLVHHHTSADDARALADELRAEGVEAWPLEADLRDGRAAAALVERATKLAGEPPGILVNSASAFSRATLDTVTWADAEESFRLHHWAPLVLARSLAALGAPGAVVNVIDATPPWHDRQHVAYQAGKGALADLTRVAARELAPRIRVNGVAPGAVLAPAGAAPGHLDAIAARLPLRRHGDAEDVADAVSYLARARFVTGVVLRVDGGASLLGGEDA